MALALLLVASFGCDRSRENQIEIGALLPLTGSGANYGRYAKNGIEVAVDEINRSGGVRGRQLHIIYEDSQSNPTSGLSGYRKLLEVDRVPATLVEFSPVVLACAPVATTQRSVLLNCGAQTPKVREASPFLYSAIPDANQEAREMAEFLYKQLGIRKVSTFSLNTDTGVATTGIFVQTFTRLGGHILSQEWHDQGTTDFKPQVTKLKSLSPPAIYMVSLVRESALILKQAQELGLRTRWFSYTSFQGEDILRVARGAAEGVIYTYPRFDPNASARAKEFEDHYRARYSEEPEVYAATFYDGVYVLKAAMEAVGISGESIREGLRKTVYEGVAGPVDFREANWVSKPLQFRTVKNGRFVEFTNEASAPPKS